MCRIASNGTSRSSANPRHDPTMTILVRFSIRMELSCSASTSGARTNPSLTSPDNATPGNGLLLFFRVDDFDMSLKRARALVARLEDEPHANPNTGTQEFALRDRDGYYVMISAFSALEMRGHEAPA